MPSLTKRMPKSVDTIITEVEAERTPIFLGLDPGANGGLAVLSGNSVEATKWPVGERDTWDLINCHKQKGRPVYAILEQQLPRGTNLFRNGAWTCPILRSTCILFGHYMQLRGMLIAAGISFEEKVPRTWQAAFSLKKDKGEADGHWKNRLKAKAQQLYPATKITLATADALLLAHYCSRNVKGGWA